MTSMDMDPTTVPELLRSDWISVVDPEDDTIVYRFPVAFLLSAYECTFGRGCIGVSGDPHMGCCTHGTHLGVNDDEEFNKVDEHVQLAKYRLTQQKQDMIARNGWWRLDAEDDTIRTRVYESVEGQGGCILYEDGHGCSLHREALLRGEAPIDWKPNICTTYPFITYEHDEMTDDVSYIDVYPLVENWMGEDDQWWCVFDRERNWNGERPVIVSLEEALVAAAGQGVYDELRARMEKQYPEAFAVPHTRVEITKKAD